jgi:2-desacetyl-2-hydroxyethyl bacteriochlorophyllide A dehydrogenase
MAYLHSGEAAYPMRIGHEWTGRVTAVGDDVHQKWLGRRVIGDTMLGCGHCDRCRAGRQHLCADRYEVGIRNGWPGALAERLRVPVSSLHELPDSIDDTAGALVEPAGNAWRAVDAAALAIGDQLLVLGAGTIGLLAALIARARGVKVELLARGDHSIRFARSLGFDRVWTAETLPDRRYDGVLDASTDPDLPALAVDLVEPGRRIVYIGLAGEPSRIDTRQLVLKDVTAVGILSGSGGLHGAIELLASGSVDPRPLVAATVSLDDLAEVLAGRRDRAWGDAPKIHVDPRTGR